MAIYIDADSPFQTLSKLKNLIDKDLIKTWEYDKDGHFTQTEPQWKNEAWFEPYETKTALIFRIIGMKDIPMTRKIYAEYHGRFIEMLIKHLTSDFENATASVNPDKSYDKVKTLV
jgi:hypothetical protein